MEPLHFKRNHCVSRRHGTLQLIEVSLSGFMVLVELERLSNQRLVPWSNKQALLWRLKQETNFWHQLFLNTTTLHHAGMAHCTAAQWGFIIRIYGRGRAGKIEQTTMRLVAISKHKQTNNLLKPNIYKGFIMDPLYFKHNHCVSRRHGTLQLSEVSLSGFMVVVELERLSNQPWGWWRFPVVWHKEWSLPCRQH